MTKPKLTPLPPKAPMGMGALLASLDIDDPPLNQSDSNIAIAPAQAVPQAEPQATPQAAPQALASTAATAIASARAIAEPYVTLDSTHTKSEQSVYSNMYRETISKGFNVDRFSLARLARLTGTRSNHTIRRALQGLIDKLSITITLKEAGDNYGTEYRIFTPKEITAARKECKMRIDPVTKKIAMAAPIATAQAVALAETPAARQAAARADLASAAIAEIAPHVKYNINPTGYDKPSSVPTPIDDEKLSKVQKLFEQLSNGGNWKDERDLASYDQIKHIPLWHIIMGLSYSVHHSPEHRMSSLAYAVPSILDHYEKMGLFDSANMTEIAYKTMRTTLLAIETGKWTIE